MARDYVRLYELGARNYLRYAGRYDESIGVHLHTESLDPLREEQRYKNLVRGVGLEP